MAAPHLLVLPRTNAAGTEGPRTRFAFRQGRRGESILVAGKLSCFYWSRLTHSPCGNSMARSMSVKADFSAAPSALGYLFQIRYALVLLLRADEPENIHA